MSGMPTSGSLTKYARRIFFVSVLVLAGAGICWAAGGADETTWKITDWYKAMNFAVLAVALFLVLRKPAANALNGRISGIQEELASLEQKKESAQKSLDDINRKIVDLEGESDRIIGEYRKQGENLKAKILENARQSAAKIEEQAKRNIENEFAAAKVRLQAEILDKAVTRAEALVRERITADDQDRLVDEYLDKVVSQ
ncbi:MAG: hypothetical protein ACLFPD_03570 [Desulfosudaceae bacterium]